MAINKTPIFLVLFKSNKIPILISIIGNIYPNLFIIEMISTPLRLNPSTRMLSKMKGIKFGFIF
jgi:hypothetical protein